MIPLSWQSKAELCSALFQFFIGRILAVESTGVQGPEGVKVTLARAPIRAETAT